MMAGLPQGVAVAEQTGMLLLRVKRKVSRRLLDAARAEASNSIARDQRLLSGMFG